MGSHKLKLCTTWSLLLTVVALLHTTTGSQAEENHEHLIRAARAIGGRGLRRGSHPWLVLLRATIVTRRFLGIPLSHYHLYCGAAIINSRWLLSAAHCFTEHGAVARNPGNWEARMATSRIRPTITQRLTDILGRVIDEDDFRQWEIDVARIILHPNFVNSEEDIRNDIALVKLSRPIPNMSAIQPIAVPDYGGMSFPQPGANCVMTGWGCTTPGGSPSTWAQQVPMPVLPSPYCRRTYSMPSMRGRICAGHQQAGIGVCMGDSGGPLVCQRTNTTSASGINHSTSAYMLAGIVSFTSRHNPEDHPAVFTKVQDYSPWISSTVHAN